MSSDTDRILSARDREEYLVDELTGTYRRGAGLFELERALVQAKRTGQSFTLSFIDVDSLKRVNDAYGHGAGDELLILIVDSIRNQIRPYDLLIRYGGDEFLCGQLGLELTDVMCRFELANVLLAVSGRASVSVGFAELSEPESLGSLIRKADDDLYRRRRQRSGLPT